MNDKYRFIELVYALMDTYREYASEDGRYRHEEPPSQDRIYQVTLL